MLLLTAISFAVLVTISHGGKVKRNLSGSPRHGFDVSKQLISRLSRDSGLPYFSGVDGGYFGSVIFLNLTSSNYDSRLELARQLMRGSLPNSQLYDHFPSSTITGEKRRSSKGFMVSRKKRSPFHQDSGYYPPAYLRQEDHCSKGVQSCMKRGSFHSASLDPSGCTGSFRPDNDQVPFDFRPAYDQLYGDSGYLYDVWSTSDYVPLVSGRCKMFGLEDPTYETSFDWKTIQLKKRLYFWDSLIPRGTAAAVRSLCIEDDKLKVIFFLWHRSYIGMYWDRESTTVEILRPSSFDRSDWTWTFVSVDLKCGPRRSLVITETCTTYLCVE